MQIHLLKYGYGSDGEQNVISAYFNEGLAIAEKDHLFKEMGILRDGSYELWKQLDKRSCDEGCDPCETLHCEYCSIFKDMQNYIVDYEINYYSVQSVEISDNLTM